MTDAEGIVIPDTLEPLLGFRVWRVVEGSRDLTLWSGTRGDAKKPPRTRVMLANPDGAWPAGETMEATCDRYGSGRLGGPKDHGEDIPAVGCACGFYATYDVSVIAGYIRGAPVLGLVQGSGRVIPGEPTPTSLGGFRAQRVRIGCLFDIADDFTIPRRRLRQLAARYQVPLVRPHSDVAQDYRELVRSGRASSL